VAVRLALAASLLIASSTSFASPQAPRLRDRAIVDVLPARARGPFGALAQQGWRATWDRDTGVAARLWGGHVDVPGAVADAAIAERAARDFLARAMPVLAPGAQVGDFVVIANQVDAGIRTIGLQQMSRGLPVIGGQLGFVFAHDRLFAISSSAWPDVASYAATGKARAILPLVRGGAVRFHGVTIRETPDERVYLDEGGREVARESTIMTATALLKYNVGVRYCDGTRDDLAVPSTAITVNGASATTSSTGAFGWTGTAPATVVPGLAGTYVRVVNQAGALATTTLTAQPSGTATWSLASDETGDAQLSTFVYANQAKARARIVNPSVAAWLDSQLDFYVNENGTCNAYSTGDDVHLFRKNDVCQNSGRLADVVYHEFGHSLHNHSVIAGMGKYEPHLSEGLADFFAANLTEDPAVGRGFYLSEAPLRDIDPIGSERVYPLDIDFDPHVSGLIISGALWDLRKALIKQLGTTVGIARTEQIFTGVMQRADDIGTTFNAALIGDDDDGDLGNGTPNYCAIERAFGRHGLVPGYQPTRVSPPRVENLELAMTVDTPTGTMCPPEQVTAIHVTWRPGEDVASTFDLVADGTTWRGAFPQLPDGTVITYAVDVVFDDGSVQTFPNNAADPRYQLFVGGAVPIYCESFNEDPAWPQASNMGLEWEWAIPTAGIAAGDPPAAFTGTHVLGTDLTSDGAYRPYLEVSTTSPEIDVSSYQNVHLQYWRWLSVEDAAFDRATIRANGVEIWHNASSVQGTLDHVDREWRFHDLDVTNYVVDGKLTLQWGLKSDFGKEFGGWTIDDVCVVGLIKIPRCGDGELDEGEQCDDHNTTSDDGCSKDCIDEVEAGGGGCCDAGGAAPGNLVLAALLALRGRRKRR
jgi:cysteine-rich repeat protein